MLIFVVNRNGSDSSPKKWQSCLLCPYVFSNGIFHSLDIKCHLALLWNWHWWAALHVKTLELLRWSKMSFLCMFTEKQKNIFCCIFWLIEFLTYLWSSNSKICIWGMCLYSTTRSAETVKCFHWLMYKHDNLGRKIYLNYLKDDFLMS